ncbi:hypothetical protein, partial [Burkholderia sp. LMG 13014]
MRLLMVNVVCPVTSMSLPCPKPFVPLHRKRTPRGVIRTMPVRHIRRTGATPHTGAARAARQIGMATHRVPLPVVACGLRRRAPEPRATRVPAAGWHMVCLVRCNAAQRATVMNLLAYPFYQW